MTSTALSPKQRLKLLEKVFIKGESVTSACKEIGVSRFTFYKWAKKYDSKTGRNANLKNLTDTKRRVAKARGEVSSDVVMEVKNIALINPRWSKYKIAKELKNKLGDKATGVHGVYNVLRRAGLNTLEARHRWKEFVIQSKRRVLNPEQRLEVIKRADELGIPVAQVSRDFGISRQTFYKWKRRWEESGRRSDALVDKKQQYDRRHLRIRTDLEKEILTIVIEAPNLSKYGIARVIQERLGPLVGPHGVYNVLLRNGLNLPESRVAYSQVHAPEIPEPVTWTDRVRYVLEEFVPSLAPAPPPRLALALATAGRLLFNFLKTFSLTTLASSATIYSFLWWINLLSQQVAQVSIGLVFASIALLMGSMFFLYSLKYYITLAIVLSFSQQEDPSPIAGRRDKGGFISWLLGGTQKDETETKKKPIGLTPDLEHITLKRHPYVSVHIPLYNETRVVERIVKAVSVFDYPEYEVIIADDSSDETSNIIKSYFKSIGKIKTTKGEGWTLTTVKAGSLPAGRQVTLKHLHRTSRKGYKGGALKLALELTDPRAEFISVFDADFVPYPDTLELFLKYFQATAGTLDFRKGSRGQGIDSNAQNLNPKPSPIAAVQGYQWHVLNKSENWITRGVRAEYAGSYVIERSGEEIYGGLKQISGAVYMIRKDVLEEVGWETSITEDFELTLKLYEKGYKVVYTPYIQAPAECVSTLKRLIRQRMRWAEGHSNNVRKMFPRILFNKNISVAEKLEFLYLSPYYLQAFFFLVGTIAWLVSETIFQARLPFWTSLWGWSLVLTNLLALPLMNAVGLFLEESEERDYQGLLSFIVLTYILVPFQAYASLKGFLEKEEGPWFRTPKTGHVTDVFTRGRFYRFISGILPGGRSAPAPINADVRRLTLNNSYFALKTANNQFNSFGIKPRKARWIGKLSVVIVLVFSLLIGNLVPLGSLGSASIEDKWLTTGESGEATIANGLTLKPVKTTFLSNEGPQFNLEVERDKISSKFKGLGPRKVEAADFSEGVQVETNVFYQGKRVDIPTEVTKDKQGGYDIRLIPSQTFKPGRYTLQTTVIGGEGVYQGSQDFNWGVLAINTNKSTYLPDETVQLSLAVLDDKGEMVCDADLELRIMNHELGRDDRLSTEDGSITVNQECHTKGFTLKPDYAAVYQVTDVGVYKMDLEAKTVNGTYSISDSFEVRETVAFDIERVAPTRIYPPETYPVSLKVKVNEDFKGEVVEKVPGTFSFTNIKSQLTNKFNIKNSDDQNETRLSWQVDWKAGETHELSYEFKAPNESPQFYLIGPLEFYSTLPTSASQKFVYGESRSWQIASDVTNLLIDASATGNTDAPTSWGDITGLTGSATVNGTGSVLLLIAHIPQELTGTDETAEYRFTVDGSATGSPTGAAFSDSTNEGSSASMVWAVDGLSDASHDFAVQWQRITGVAQTDASQTRTLQVIEIEDNASIIIDKSNSAGSADPASWEDVPSLVDTVTPTANSLHLFIADFISASGSDATTELQFAVDGTRDGPISRIWTDSGSGLHRVGTGMLWAETGLSATSQALSVQWQEVPNDNNLALDSGRPSIFQVVEITDNFALPVDVEVATTDTSDGTYNDIAGMSGSATPNNSTSVMLFWGIGTMDGGGDRAADLRLADDGTREGAELTNFADNTEDMPGYLVARAKTGITGSHTFSLQWTTRGSAISTDTSRERTFQVVDFQTPPTYNQSAYRLFNNDNATTVTTAIAAQDTAGTLASADQEFRLRAMIHIGDAQLDSSAENFKLQFAERSGTCDTSFSGESYADVTTVSSIKYNNNSSPSDGDNLTENGSLDPDHGSDTTVAQDYEEANNFTNTVAVVPAGEDGLWDFALADNTGGDGKTYCFRMVISDATTFATYTVIPEITTVPENPLIMLGLFPVFGWILTKMRKKRVLS